MKSSVETPTEFSTETSEANGVTTETRIYKNNPRISKVVITTRDGKRTARVYSVKGEEKEIPANDVEAVLQKTGDEIANAAGFVADKAEDVGGKAKDVGEKVGDKAKDVGSEAADKTEDVIQGTGNRAKKVGEKAVEGAKSAGKAIKKVVTP